MTEWTGDELAAIGDAEELGLASRRADGTLRRPVTMWVVRVGAGIIGGVVNPESRAATIELIPER
ncbi:DUF2255 family protein [Nonomuraea sp. GTA35]|uniref:DUF2255 family protein n=1 Tax=Nonomuraea sp. GTA35 TaxID=1676746 RepID=UPI0035C141DE